jgi:alanine dehydrogenase
MLIGVPKEIKVQEYRVGPAPDSVRKFTSHGTGSSSNRMQGPAL